MKSARLLAIVFAASFPAATAYAASPASAANDKHRPRHGTRRPPLTTSTAARYGGKVGLRQNEIIRRFVFRATP